MAGTQILSIIAVMDSRRGDPEPALRKLHRCAGALELGFELVVVVNGRSPREVELARALTSSLDSLQVYVIERRVDFQTALLAGLENAIGDWVVTLDLVADDPHVVGDLLSSAQTARSEVAIGVPDARPRRPLGEAFLAGSFHFAFRKLHGFSLALESPTARLMSRAVLNQILRHDSPLIALETLAATKGQPRAVVSTTRLAEPCFPLNERARMRWRTLMGIDAAPLRLANLVCGLGALGALLYSAYVVAVFLVKPDVMPGWTTLSLILSAMFLTMSVVLGMLSEYLIHALDPAARRGRYEICEELTSGVQPRDRRLNVEVEL
jgi:hypothetical protein